MNWFKKIFRWVNNMSILKRYKNTYGPLSKEEKKKIEYLNSTEYWANIFKSAEENLYPYSMIGVSIVPEKEPSDLCLQTATKAWTQPKTSNKEMDSDLAYEFAKIIDSIWSKPWLGNATNKELLDELETRINIHWDLYYKTTR